VCALAAVHAVTVVLFIGGRPVWRGFFCDDETIRYRYKSNSVTLSMLLVVVFIVVPITVSTLNTVHNTVTITDMNINTNSHVYGHQQLQSTDQGVKQTQCS